MYFTTDSAHTRDMDDAIELFQDGEALVVRVAISDVARKVTPDCKEDMSAGARGATQYFARGNSPMLSRQLSEWHLSLVPNRPRNVVVVEMRVTALGDVVGSRLYLDTITSSARLSYDQIPTMIEDPSDKLNTELVLARNLAHVLLGRRRASGAMVMYDLNNGWVTNEEGALKQLESKDETIGYIIIQELMILANSEVAKFAIEHNIPVIFRNHEAKSALDRPALMQRIQEATVAPIADLGTLQQQTHILLGRAYYKATLAGHFGLNLPAYLHFTSPIRRYADLANHQQIRAFLKGKPVPRDQEHMETVSLYLNHLADEARKRTSEFFKGRAEDKARRQISARQLDGLPPKDFERALKVELRSKQPPSEAMQEAWIRRLDQNTVPPLCMTELLIDLSLSEEWQVLKEATVEALEDRPEDAITVLTQAASLGWPAFEHKGIQEGPPHAPTFTAQLTLRLDERDCTYSASVTVTHGSAKLAKQWAAVRLLKLIVENVNNVSHSDLKLKPKTGAPAPVLKAEKGVKVDLNKNPVSMLMEVAQAEKVAPPDFGFTQSGPSHAPTFKCVARFKHWCVEVDAASKQGAKEAAARGLVQKLLG